MGDQSVTVPLESEAQPFYDSLNVPRPTAVLLVIVIAL
jgi:hypothetical protein